KYMTCFALFVDVFYKISSYKIYLPQLIEKLHIFINILFEIKFIIFNFTENYEFSIFKNLLDF
ncbi:MAG: hypothetical protein BWK75_03860, partial [Candidatus Altiarchaeales archaeon A3]